MAATARAKMSAASVSWSRGIPHARNSLNSVHRNLKTCERGSWAITRFALPSLVRILETRETRPDYATEETAICCRPVQGLIVIGTNGPSTAMTQATGTAVGVLADLDDQLTSTSG